MQLEEVRLFKEMCEGISVLMVDDEVNLVHYFKEIAERFFTKVEIANSAEEAIIRFEEGKYDIIYTDLNMPGMSGIELIRTLTDLSPKQKFVVISASDDSSKLMELLSLNISGFIVKPFTLDKFVTISMEQLSILRQSRLIEEKARELQQQLVQVTKEKKEQEEMLIQQSKLAQTGEMISMIAHQWRQPLSSITAVLSDLKTRLDLGLYDQKENPLASFSSDFDTMFSKIEDSALFLSKTINDFRNFYRPDNEAQFFNVCKSIEKVLGMLQLKRLQIDVQLTCVHDPEARVNTFESELKQVFMSILNNAVDALVENAVKTPKISLSVESSEENITIYITDNAGGIPEDIIENIFLPYFSTKSDKNGTGLGLHMAKTIIQQHIHGNLSVRNSTSFGGAEFMISIPKTEKG